MENKFAPYECQFTIEERKKIVAQTLKEIRVTKGYSQKEVAALLGLSQPRYSGYETGRAEPPIEILVRLAYLYKVPVDILTQKDRLHRTREDVAQKIEELSKQIQLIESQLTENGGDNPTTQQLLGGMKMLLQEMQKMSENPATMELLESTLTTK